MAKTNITDYLDKKKTVETITFCLLTYFFLSRWSRTSNFDEINLPLPDIVPIVLPKPRTLVVQRQKPPRSDFGFSLRRAMVLERTGSNALEGNNN